MKEQLSKTEVSSIFGQKNLEYYIKIGKLTPRIVSTNQHLFQKEEVDSLQKEIETFANNHYTVVEAMNALGIISHPPFNKLIKNKTIEIEYADTFVRKRDIKKWINKEQVHSFLNKIENDYVEFSFAEKQLGMTEAELFFDIQNLDKIYIHGKYFISRTLLKELKSNKYYTVNTLANILEKKAVTILKLLRQKKYQEIFKDIVISSKMYKVSKKEVDSYLKKMEELDDEYFTILELNEFLQLSEPPQGGAVKSIEAPLFYKLLTKKQQVKRLYNKKDAQRFLEMKELNNSILNSNYIDPCDTFKGVFNTLSFPSHLTETKKFIVSFAEDKFSSMKRNSDNTILSIKNMIDMVKYIIDKHPEDDLFHLTSTQVHLLLDSCPTKTQSQSLWNLLIFMEERRLCRYKTKNLTSPYSKSLMKKKEKTVLSFDEFIGVYEYCQDIKKYNHIENAIKDKEYANIWLFTMILLTNAWRPNDVFRIPPISPELIGVTSKRWFLENQLTVPKAQKIINIIHSMRLVTSKNGAPRDFTCNLELVVPMVTAMCICEYHRRETSNLPILVDFTNENRKKNNIKPVYFQRFLNRCEELKHIKFNGLIANRSLLEHLFYSIQEKKGKGNSAFELMMKFRKHKTDITKEYISGEKDTIALQLFDRGEFGYIYERIIEVISTNENQTLTERTDNIKKIKSFFNPIEVENLSTFISKISNEEEETLLSKFLTLTPDEALEHSRKLYLGQMPSKKADIDCLVYPDCHRRSKKYNCSTCPFAVHTVYALTSVFEEFESSYNKYITTDKKGVKLREQRTLLKLQDVILRAIDKYGEEYVFSFYQGENGESGFVERLQQLGGK